MTKQALLGLIRKRIKEAESATRVADKLDVSPQYLSDVVNGKREPGEKILKALGLERVVLYRARKEEVGA